MSPDEARQLIPLYRTGRPAESRVGKAIRLAESDDGLQQELNAQIEFDGQLVEVIGSIEPPEDLWAKMNHLRANGGSASRKRRQVFNPAILCAISGMLLLIGFGVWRVLAAADDFPGRGRVETFIKMNERMTGAELEPTQSTAGQLGDNMMLQGFNGFTLPQEIASLPAIGWRVFREGQSSHRVAQFVVENHNTVVFVFRSSDFGVQPDAAARWRTFEFGGWAAAITERGGMCTVLTFRGREPEMKTFLSTLKP